MKRALCVLNSVCIALALAILGFLIYAAIKAGRIPSTQTTEQDVVAMKNLRRPLQFVHLPSEAAAVRFSQSGNLLYIGSRSHLVIHNIKDQTQQSVLSPLEGIIGICTFPIGDTVLLMSSVDGSIVVWDYAKDTTFANASMPKAHPVDSFAISEPARAISGLYFGRDSKPVFFDYQLKRHPINALVPESAIVSILGAGGTKLYSLDKGGEEIHVANVIMKVIVDRIKTDCNADMLTISPDERLCAVANHNDGYVCVIDLQSGKRIAESQISTFVNQIAFSADGHNLFICGGHNPNTQGIFVVIDMATAKRHEHTDLVIGGVLRVSVSPDEKLIAILGHNGYCAIFEIESLK